MHLDENRVVSRRGVLLAGLATTGGLALGGGVLAAGPAAAVPRIDRVLARNLSVPWGIAFLPGGNALVGERDSGDVYVVRKRGGRRRVGSIAVFSQKAASGEGGLLGLALHPDFGRNRWVYAYVSTRSDNRVVRMRYRDGQLGGRQVVLAGIPMSISHNGGGLTFGPDGLLYVSTGDAEEGSNAQSPGSLGGKVLRITPTGQPAPGNPFGNHTWSMGHRNVEGIAFDERGNLWASEFGEKEYDELNRIRPGRNYGWPRVEGPDGRGGYNDPFVEWSPTSSSSPAGVAVADGRAWVGALRGQCLFSVRLRGERAGLIRRHFAGRWGRIRQVAKAPDGSLWITTSNRDGRGDPGRNDDKVIRITI